MNDEQNTIEAQAVGKPVVGEQPAAPAPLAPTSGSACRPSREDWDKALAQMTDEQVEALYREVCKSSRTEKAQKRRKATHACGHCNAVFVSKAECWHHMDHDCAVIKAALAKQNTKL
jgi:hypothetical protein